MNPVAMDILMHYGVGAKDNPPGRGSGRYPLGSGEKPNQRSGDFVSRVKKFKQEGYTEAEIARMMGYSYTDNYGKEHSGVKRFRAAYNIAKNEDRAARAEMALNLRDQGYTLKEITEKMGYKNDSSVRTLLNQSVAARKSGAMKTADFLQEQVDSRGMIDVGVGAEREIADFDDLYPLGGMISRTKMDIALEILRERGYEVYKKRREQVTNPGKYTEVMILCPPGTEYREVYDDTKIHSLRDYITRDGGKTFEPKWVYPESMDSKRLSIVYDEDGGTKKDGLIEIRRGVDDLSLGNSHYAQVRILVDGTHYIKGMAVYADDLPEGIDVRFNTNKKSGTPMTKVLKEITNDPENPFGSLIKEGINDPDNPTEWNGGQSYYIDKNGVKRLSLINKRADEGDWDAWKDKLPSQFLAKQPLEMINRQLRLAIDDKVSEYNDIMACQNPTIRKKLLQDFADDCDSAAVHLKAAALPRQKYKVLLPLTEIKDDEVYAPGFIDGEKVALVRFPYASNAERPILTVNNKLPEGIRVMGTSPKDAIGINKKVADRMSGADFDGDAAMCIPCNSPYTKTRFNPTRPLEDLDGFATSDYGADREEKDADGVTHYYRNGHEYKVMSEGQKQVEMGKASNLITDMTLRGANEKEIAKAVKHSMVVIDSVKHKLDYKQSEIDNDIHKLKELYQARYDEEGNYHDGASTLISRAKSEVSVEKRQGTPKINEKGKPWYDSSKPEGALIYKTAYDLEYEEKKKVRKKDPSTGKYLKDDNGNYIYETVVDPETGKSRFVYEGTGKIKTRTEQSTQMAETDDARTLISDLNTPQEQAYANYANTMKSMANQARKDYISTGSITYSKSAKEAYQTEVDSLLAKLNVALKNAPREREAQRIATINVDAKKQSNPDMTKPEIKKARNQSLAAARVLVGAERHPIDITDREYEAIQAGAISENTLSKILDNTDVDKLRERATPRSSKELSEYKQTRIKTLKESGYTTAEIARAVGVSTSTVNKYL